MSWATAAKFRVGDNPASLEIIRHLLPKRSSVKRVTHYAALPYREIPSFMSELRQQKGVAARALEFAILTATRSIETLGAQWSELDLEQKIWTIPAERMKARKGHVVPLPDHVIEILQELPREADNEFVFIGSRRGRGLNMLALSDVLGRIRDDVTVHGFRSSFSDWAHEQTAHSNHAIEISLAHSVGSEVERAYRRSDQALKRKALMTAWAKYCLSRPARQADNVIGIGGIR